MLDSFLPPLTLCMLGNFACFFIVWIFYLKTEFFKKNLLGIPSEYQTVWIQIRPDILSGLIWVQTVCKAYQQRKKSTLAGKELKGLFLKATWSCEIEVCHMGKKPNSNRQRWEKSVGTVIAIFSILC